MSVQTRKLIHPDIKPAHSRPLRSKSGCSLNASLSAALLLKQPFRLVSLSPCRRGSRGSGQKSGDGPDPFRFRTIQIGPKDLPPRLWQAESVIIVGGALAALPDVPTIGETVPGYEVSISYGISAPRGTPPEIVGKLNQAVNAVLNPKLQARLAELGGEPMPMTPTEFGKLVAEETEKWATVIRAANIKAE